MKLNSSSFFGGAAALYFAAAALTGVLGLVGSAFVPSQPTPPPLSPGISDPTTPPPVSLPDTCSAAVDEGRGDEVPVFGARMATTELVEPTSDIDGFSGARGMGYEVLTSEYFEETGCADKGKKWLFIRIGTAPVEAQFKTDFSYRYSTVLDEELSDIVISIDGKTVSSVDTEWDYDPSWGYAFAEVPADTDTFDFSIDVGFNATLSDDPAIAKKHDERFGEVPLGAQLTYSTEFELTGFKAQSRVCDGGEPGC